MCLPNIDELIKQLEHGFKISSYAVRDELFYGFTIKGNEKAPESEELFTYQMTIKKDDRSTEFYNKLAGAQECFEKRFLRRDLYKGFVLVDIAGFSTLTVDKQIALLSRYQSIVLSHNQDGVPDYSSVFESFIVTGDGCYIVFNENGRMQLIDYAELLLSDIIAYNDNEFVAGQINVRISINYGLVDYFYDLNKKWNYIGDGINDTARIMGLIPKGEKNVIYVSEEAKRNAVNMGRTYSDLVRPADKHGKQHSLYKVIT